MLITKPPVHPGKILEEEFLIPLNLGAGTLARAIGVLRTRIERLVKGATTLSADTALRLGRFFGTGPEFWPNLRLSQEASALAGNTEVLRRVEAITPFGKPRAA